MTIYKIQLNETGRLSYTATHFGDNFPFRIEPAVFNMARILSSEYTGGYWHFFDLSNGGFFMSPDSDTPFRVSCMNGYEGDLSAEAFGIVVTLFAYSHLSFSDSPGLSEVCAEQFHLLREYALDHPEARSIFAAIN